MSREQLTGQTRYRTEPRGVFGGSEPLLVLQVECRRPHYEEVCGMLESRVGNYWRDARVSDVTDSNFGRERSNREQRK